MAKLKIPMQIKYWLICILFFFTNNVYAQEAVEKKGKVDLSSPYHTIYTHLYYLQEDSYEPEVAARTFSLENRSIEEAEDLAIRLKQILDGEGIYIDMDLLPRKSDYYDSTSQQAKYVLSNRYPDIYLVKKENGRWLYSEKTAERIDPLYKEVFPFGTHKLLDWLPRLGQKKMMGLHLWQYIGILILIVVAFVVHRL